MLARHAAERRALVEAGRASAGSVRDLARRHLAAKYAEKLARVFDSADAAASWAARERLKLEEAIESAQLDLANTRSETDAVRSALSGLRQQQRAERQGLAHRQRRQRAVLGVIVTARRPRKIPVEARQPRDDAAPAGSRRFWHRRPQQ
jgi:hypothetical protein